MSFKLLEQAQSSSLHEIIVFMDAQCLFLLFQLMQITDNHLLPIADSISQPIVSRFCFIKKNQL